MPYTIKMTPRTISDRQLADYEFYLNENYTDGLQIENKGQEQDYPLDITRNALDFDGLGDYILTTYQPLANSTVEARIVPTVGAAEAHYFGNSDFLAGQNAAGNAILTYGGVTATGSAVTTATEQVWKIVATSSTAATLYINDVVAASVTTGSYSATDKLMLGASNDGVGGSASEAVVKVLRVRAWDSAVLAADYRCRTRDVDTTPGAERLIDDTGNHTIDNSVTPGSIVGVDLTADVESTYGAIAPTGGTVDSSSYITDPAGDPYLPVSTGESFTVCVDFEITGTLSNARVLIGGVDSTSGFGYWQGPYYNSGVIYIRVSHDSGTISLATIAIPSARSRIAVAYDVENDEVRIHQDGTEVRAPFDMSSYTGWPNMANANGYVGCGIGFGNTFKEENLTTHGFRVWNRAISDAEAINWTNGGS